MGRIGVLRVIRYAAWISVVAVLAVGSVAYWIGADRLTGGPSSRASGPLPKVGGSFSLTTHTGQPFGFDSFKGKPAAVFFGFTHCPDVCPTTLAEMTEILKLLGSDGDRLLVIFVAVDVERDTRELVGLYLQSFDPRILGLVGSKEEMDKAARAFNAVYEKAPAVGGGYTVNHTASVILIDRDSKFAGMLDYHEAIDVKLKKVRRLLSR